MSMKKYRSSRAPDVAARYQAQTQALKDMHNGHVPCQLCSNIDNKIVSELNTVKVIENLYPYKFFDGRLVAEHLMLIPKRHINHMSDFAAEERGDYWQALVEYYELGYTTVTRTAFDSNRTVADHIHTHLFKYVKPESA